MAAVDLDGIETDGLYTFAASPYFFTVVMISSFVIGRGVSPPAFVGMLEEETVSIPVLAEDAEAPAWLIWIATVAPFL